MRGRVGQHRGQPTRGAGTRAETRGARLGRALLSLRELRGWTQQRVAEESRCSIGYISLLERGFVPNPRDAAEAVAAAYGFSGSDHLMAVLYGDPWPEPRTGPRPRRGRIRRGDGGRELVPFNRRPASGTVRTMLYLLEALDVPIAPAGPAR